MDSQPSQSPPPNAKSGAVGSASTTVPSGPAVHAYPKPAPLLPRFVMLCLRPESWAEAARYPTRFTLIPLLLAVLLGAVGIGISDTWRNVQGMRNFAAGYDSRGYPTLELNSDGVLSAK